MNNQTTLLVGKLDPTETDQMSKFLDVAYQAEFRVVEVGEDSSPELQVTGEGMGGVFLKVKLHGHV